MPDLPRLPSPPAARVLVADDNGDVIEALRLLLKGEGFAVATAASPGGIRAAIEEQVKAAAELEHLAPGEEPE